MKRDNRFSLEKGLKDFQEMGSITEAAKKQCKELGVEYKEMYRHALSKFLLRKGITKKLNAVAEKKPIKILISDIETSMISFYGFSPYNKYVHADNMIEDWFMLTASSKWLFGDEIYSFKLTKKELKRHDDRRIVEQMWKLLDEADIVVFYNGAKFDMKKLNAKFFQYGLGLPSPVKLFDPFITVKQRFGLTYSGLDAVCKLLNIPGKIENEKGLWKKVMQGDIDALDSMSKYNDRDTLILEQVYLEIRPYAVSHPNIGLYIAEDVQCCPTCGSEDIKFDKGSDYFTSVNRFRTFQCGSCQSWGRERKALKIGNKNLTIGIAR